MTTSYFQSHCFILLNTNKISHLLDCLNKWNLTLICNGPQRSLNTIRPLNTVVGFFFYTMQYLDENNTLIFTMTTKVMTTHINYNFPKLYWKYSFKMDGKQLIQWMKNCSMMDELSHRIHKPTIYRRINVANFDLKFCGQLWKITHVPCMKSCEILDTCNTIIKLCQKSGCRGQQWERTGKKLTKSKNINHQLGFSALYFKI